MLALVGIVALAFAASYAGFALMIALASHMVSAPPSPPSPRLARPKGARNFSPALRLW